MERRLPVPEPVQKDKAKKEPAMDDDDCDEEEEEEEEAMDGRGGAGNDDDKKRRSSAFNGGILRRGGGGGGGGSGGGGGGGSFSQPCCQVEKCGVDLADAKRYHRRHKVCEAHFKAPVVIVAGIRQRFCQQCSRFHELSEFDESKRSCRRRLAGHNERRRKSSSESQGEGSSRCRQADQSERMQMPLPGNPTYKHFQIR